MKFETGQEYKCIKDCLMSSGSIAFIKGRIYKCSGFNFGEYSFWNEQGERHYLGDWTRNFKSLSPRSLKIENSKKRKEDIINILKARIKTLEGRQTFYDSDEYSRTGALGELQDLLEYLEGEYYLYLTPHKS